MLWYALRKHGWDGFREIVTEMLAVAQYAVERFNERGIPAWRNEHSVTVVFPKPAPRWSASGRSLPMKTSPTSSPCPR